ncbi:MAG: ABC transporter substrate-binding protein [Nocardioidaceae bacterium]
MATQLVLGTFTPSVLLAVARRLGGLDAHGLGVDEVPVPSSPAQFRSLLAGELDAVFTSPDNVVAYRFCPDNPLGATADVAIVSAVDRGMGLALYGRSPSADTADRLRGATVGVDVPTSGFALALYALAESLGLGRDDYEVVALGSTPQRLEALLEGRCDATMLNAGNELVAEQAGCVRLAGVAEVCPPYLGTVLGVAGTQHLDPARALSEALRQTAREICSGRADDVAAEEAEAVLGLPEDLALRYVDRLKDAGEGLVVDDVTDLEALATVVSLRRHYLPCRVDGVDVLERALDATSGLLASRPTVV